MAGQVNVLPDRDAAFETLYSGVQARVFFNKLAARGYVPRTQKEAAYLLDLGTKLQAVAESEPVKRAEDERNIYYMANQALDAVLGQHGLDGGIKQAAARDRELGLQHAAIELAQDPAVYNAVLAMKAAEAEQLAAAQR